MQQLRKLLDTADTPPGILVVALAGAEKLLAGNDAQDRDYADPEYQRLADRQESIGWANMLKGRISKTWGEQQRTFQHPPAKDADKWCKSLTLFMLQKIFAIVAATQRRPTRP